MKNQDQKDFERQFSLWPCVWLVQLVIVFIFAGFPFQSYAATEFTLEALKPRLSSSTFPPGIKWLVLKIYSNDPVERVKAVQTLGNLRSEAVPAVPFLIAILQDGREIRWGVRERDTIRPVRVTTVLREIQIALGKIGSPASKHLVEALRDEAFHSRPAAISALGYVKDHRAVEYIKFAGHDKDHWVRRSVPGALMMARPNDAEAVQYVLGMIKDPHHHVRHAAMVALGESKDALNDPRVISALIQEIRHPHPHPSVRLTAFRVLAKSKDQKADAVFTEVINNKNEKLSLRCETIVTYSEMGRKSSIGLTIKMIEVCPKQYRLPMAFSLSNTLNSNKLAGPTFPGPMDIGKPEIWKVWWAENKHKIE